MLPAFQSSIASAVRKTLRFLRMASTPADPFAFEKLEPNGTDIERYIVNLVNGYNAHGTTRMQRYRVQELYHCKERTGVGHEYASVKVVGPDSPFYIIFERFRGPSDSDKAATSTEPTTRAVHSSSDSAVYARNLSESASDSSPSLQDRLAGDKASMSLTPTRTGSSTDEIHRTVAFKDPIPLYMVVVLAATIHRSQVKYDLSGDSSCYFYAAAIMAVIEKFYSARISHINNTKSTWAELGRVPFVKRTPMSRMYSAPKTQPEATVQAIIASYKVDLEKFEINARFVTLIEI